MWAGMGGGLNMSKLCYLVYGQPLPYLLCHSSTNRVHSLIILVGAAKTIPKPSSHWIGRANLKRISRKIGLGFKSN